MKRISLFWLLAVLGALGGIIGGFVYQADRQLRTDLIQQARLVAHAVDLDHVGALTGTEADLASSDYLRIKQHLSRYMV